MCYSSPPSNPLEDLLSHHQLPIPDSFEWIHFRLQIGEGLQRRIIFSFFLNTDFFSFCLFFETNYIIEQQIQQILALS